MDELYSIISELTERYTGGDSTSVRYEIAEQLTEAVCYCIDQVWNHDGLVPENQEVRGIYEAGSAQSGRGAAALQRDDERL